MALRVICRRRAVSGTVRFPRKQTAGGLSWNVRVIPKRKFMRPVDDVLLSRRQSADLCAPRH